MALNNILARVSSAETAAQREPGSVRLIAVSKVQPNHRVSDMLQKEYRCFGENTVQETEGKWPGFRQKYDGIDLHLIGPLQSNKARKAFELFQSIHTLDRLKLANTFARLAQEMGQCPDLFIQVNTGEEPQKAGVMPGEVDAFVAECASLDLPVKGLMCIPPVEEEASLHFALLAKMAKRNGLSGLSMGMSSDFERAISFGATHIRVGSAIFGDRVPN
ncbi:MAG: YggS family pyridoxal phosphate-dependent enzyme [Ascidiaceihabitans sp.]|nr:YggS family pyridoxal phosphate-dependent enzyme [Ascidiaceihabitans sp.]